MDTDECSHGGEAEQPPAAEPEKAEDERQADDRDEYPRGEVAHCGRRSLIDHVHLPPNLRLRRAYSSIAARNSSGPKSGQSVSVKTYSAYADCQRRKFADALLARRADDEIRIGHVWFVERRGEGGFVELVRVDAGTSDQPPRRVDDLSAAAVVERDPQAEARVRRRPLLEAVHLLLEPVGRAVAQPEEPRAHSLLREIVQLAVDRLAEGLHQRADLDGRLWLLLSVENAYTARVSMPRSFAP